MRAREQKRAKLAEILNTIAGARTLAVLSLHGLPAALFAQIRAKARGKAHIVVARATLLRKALRKVGAARLIPRMLRECALIASDLGPFELYELICAHEVNTYIKPGQLAHEDVIVRAGETQLPPGPILSELKAAGLDARVVGGKVTIAKDTVVAKAGTKITKALAAILRKLDIKPIKLRAHILAALSEGICFGEDTLCIDRVKFAQCVSEVARGAHAIALEIAWPTPETIAQLVQRAHFGAQKVAIDGAIPLPGVIEQMIKNAHAQVLNISAKIGG